MKLVIFDIDGTLTQTDEADSDCFVRALDEVFGFRDIDSDWSVYRHTTDSSILHEIHEARNRRPPDVLEVARFRHRFVELLTAAGQEARFAPVPGAQEMLARLVQSPDHRVALATGAWSDSARMKMSGAGLCFDDFPAASSDDAFDRESIISIAARRASERHGNFDRLVYVGDGVWDARACRALGIPFVGIGEDKRAERLMEEGAAQVFANFSDIDAFLQCLHRL